MRKTALGGIALALATLSALPPTMAARSGIGPLDKGIEVLSSVFYPSALLQDETLQIGFFKFLYFIIIFTMVNWVLNKQVFNKDGDDQNGKRAASVIAFAFSAIGAWFLPAKIALGTGGMITAILILLLPIGITFGLAYYAMIKLKKNWMEHLFGLLLLILATAIISWTLGLIQM
ncbi:MAG: hypothetical protein ACLFO2_02335 [Candidatus Woesearchaeota archaeon]